MNKILSNKEFSSPIEFNFSCDKNIFMFKNEMLSLVKRGIPFVIKKHVPEALYTKWQNFSYLLKKLDNIELPIECYKNSFYDINNIITTNLTFKEYIDYLKSSTSKEKLYLAELELFNRTKKKSILQILNTDIQNYDQFYIEKLSSRVLFLGKDTITQMHYHNTVEAMLNQINGLKRIFLFPPNNKLFYQMKPYPWYNSKNNLSQITFQVNNPRQFKEMATHRGLKGGIEIALEPGDSLYIPIYWWHIVFGENISMSFTDLFYTSFYKKYLSFLGLRSRNYMTVF